jgi:hypothetical protein
LQLYLETKAVPAHENQRLYARHANQRLFRRMAVKTTTPDPEGVAMQLAQDEVLGKRPFWRYGPLQGRQYRAVRISAMGPRLPIHFVILSISRTHATHPLFARIDTILAPLDRN